MTELCNIYMHVDANYIALGLFVSLAVSADGMHMTYL